MRWKKKQRILAATERRVPKFAWLPTDVEDHVVWLERYIVVQKYIINHYNQGSWRTMSKHLAVYYP